MYQKALLTSCIFAISACAYNTPVQTASDLNSFKISDNYQANGVILISQQVPSEKLVENTQNKYFAPLFGYFPATEVAKNTNAEQANLKSYLPASNESWIQIAANSSNSSSSKISLFKGENKLKEINAEGKLSIPAGNYFLEKKEEAPKWYAPDSYFSKRNLSIPSTEDSSRFRTGAFGSLALFANKNHTKDGNSLVLHSSKLWTEDVGGLKMSKMELKELTEVLELGAYVVVRMQ